MVHFPAFYLSLAGAVGLGIVVLWWLAATVRRGWRGLIDRPESPLVALGAVTLLAVVVSNNLRYWWGEPRYLLPIYSTVPFFAAYLVALGRRSRPAFFLLLAAVLVVNARGNLLVDPVETLPTVEYRGIEYSPIPMDTAGLAAVLLERGDTRVYTDYWIAYVLTFESQERILVAPITNQFSLSVVRLPDQVDAVRQSPRAACVFVANTQLEQEFARQMAASGVQYERTEASGFAVYDALDPPWHPVD